MKKQKTTAILICLIVVAAAFGFSACASIASAEQQGSIDAQVQTAAAATLVQYMIETEVAVQAQALVAEPVVQPQQTDTPAPTATLAPTETAQPTAVPTLEPPAPTSLPTLPPAPVQAAAAPKIIADLNTNCRAGPSTRYTVETIFLKGSQSSVEGRNTTKNWWYIIDPNNSSNFCWVWAGSTTVVGDTSSLAVVDAPAFATTTTTYPYYNYNYNPNFCNPYNCYAPPNVYYDPFGCINYPNWQTCKPNQWWSNCTPNIYCNCKPVCKNPCKKSNCPPLTQVNYKNYCKNYPKCCSLWNNKKPVFDPFTIVYQ